METAAISYRVADFLKQHTPFRTVDEADLLALAAQGRVRFFEPNAYILWQGEPHRLQVFVIQQGTVSLWDESGDRPTLRDVLGAGDMLGNELFIDARACLYSARSESEVVIYAFPASDFETFVLKYPHAVQYVKSEAGISPDYHAAGNRREPTQIFLHEMGGQHAPSTCREHDSIADAARCLLGARAEAIAVVDAAHRPRAVLTADTLLEWVAAGGGDAQAPVARLLRGTPATVAPDASVTRGVLEMAAHDAGALGITTDGTPGGRLQAIVTPADLAPVFGEHPATLLREIRRAASTQELRDLNQRARACILDHLASAASMEWLAEVAHLVDVAIVTRIVALLGGGEVPGCWCFCGSSGRRESLTMLAPHILVVLDDRDAQRPALAAFQQVLDALPACGYLPRDTLPFESSSYVSNVSEWKARYRAWVRDPVVQEMYRARTLFDLRPVLGRRALWTAIDAAVMEVVDHDFLHVLANDCLASLPPLTFFQDAVVDRFGEQDTTFRLEHSALRPIVDVGRVFGLAARTGLGRSTLDRFAIARTLLPEHEAIFREAADTFRIVLWQQGRIGIGQGTSGAELPPALLSRHDRQVLKGGFRSIHRLLQFTADPAWLDAL